MSEKVFVNICDKRKCPGPVYAVKKGDTLYSIAQKYHCRVRTLLDLNPFVDIYNLQPGEEICVPDCRGQGKVDFRPYVVKEGDTLSLGSHTLQFVMAPMVHWPEVMVAYETSEKILFSEEFIRYQELQK